MRAPKSPYPSTATRAWVLILLALVYMFGFIDRMVIQTLVQPIKADLGLSDLELGLLGGLSFAVLHSTLSIPIARIAERRNRVVIVAIGTAFWSAATALCAATGSFFQLLLARIGIGVGEAAGLPAATSLISDHFPPHRRSSAMAVYMLAVPLGALVGAAGGGVIAEAYGWRNAFLAAGLPGFVLAALVYFTIREPIRGLYDPTGESHDDAPPLAAVTRRFVAIPALRYLVIGATCSTTAGYGVNFFVAAYLNRRFGLDFAEAGVVSGLIGSVPGILGMLAGGLLADRLAPRRPAVYAVLPACTFALTTPLFVVTFLQNDWIAFSLLLTLTSFVQISYIPITTAVVQNMMSSRMRASASAVTNALYSLVGLGLGPLIVGWMSDLFAVSDLAAFGLDASSSCIAAKAGEPCPTAAARGLQLAMIAFSSLYLAGSAFLLLSSRTLARDLRAAQTSS